MKAVLFDLDGTLLPVENDLFINQYLKLIAQKLAPYIIPEQFIPQLLASTSAMIADNDETKTNETVFLEDFFSKVDIPQETLMPVFDDFYNNEYKQIKEYTRSTPISREIVELLISKGYQIVLATNPVFPRIAIEERLRWAEIGPKVFKLITTYENMHFCKPNIKYYQEIIKKLELAGTECLMVGNDVQEDLVAAELGIKTYLITDYLIDRSNSNNKADYRGSLIELKKFISKAF